jgi:uncharacterized protein (TIGR03067 family)
MRIAPRLALALIVLAPALSRSAADEPAKPSAALDPARLVGTWEMASAAKGAETKGEADLEGQSLVITEKTMTFKTPFGEFVMDYTLDAKATPAKIAMTMTASPFGAGAKSRGVIEVKEDTLRLCYSPEEGGEPTEFTAEGGARLCVLKRAAAK